MTLTVQTSQSSGTGSERLIRYSNSPLATRSTSTGFVPSFLGVNLDPFPCISSTQVTPSPAGAPLGSDLDDDFPESISSKLVESSLNSGKPPFDSDLKSAVWDLALNFAETSPLLCGFRRAGVAKERIIILTLEAVMQQCKSVSNTKSTVKNVSGLVRYFLDFRSDEEVTLTGESSLVLIHDYLEQAASRGRTVPASIRQSLNNWATALQIEWPLDHSLVNSACAVEQTTPPKQAPAMAVSTIKLLEGIAINKEVTPFKRQFAAGILLMSYASLRFSDAQRLKSLEVNSDSVFGTLLHCKTKKPHGLDWPWACPIMGMTGTKEWIQPILDYRDAHLRTNGVLPSFTFPCVNHVWELESAKAAPYSATRRKLALLCTALGDPNGELYTLHSPKNLFPTAANQMNFDRRELNIIGNWSSPSRMPERYDRAVCATELLLRNTIIQRFVSGWGLTPSFHLPETVTDHHRIRKEAPLCSPTQTEDLPGATPVGDTVLADAEQETPPLLSRPAEGGQSCRCRK